MLYEHDSSPHDNFGKILCSFCGSGNWGIKWLGHMSWSTQTVCARSNTQASYLSSGILLLYHHLFCCWRQLVFLYVHERSRTDTLICDPIQKSVSWSLNGGPWFQGCVTFYFLGFDSSNGYMTHGIFLLLGVDAKLNITFFFAKLLKEFHSQHLMTLIVWLETMTTFSFKSVPWF